MKMITDSAALQSAMDALAGSEFVTVDTEFLRETTYWPILCLVQIANDDHVFLIDPLAPDIDMSPLYKLMADTSVIKVFHAARQDIEIFINDGKVLPAPLFDTQVAAMVCGFGEQVSYEQLATKLADARIDKTSRFTDWSRRPLNDAQLQYAAGDVTHLRVVYRALKEQLEKTGRTAWVGEEMAVLASHSTYVTEPEDAWKRLKFRPRKPIELAILQHVAAWREQEAQNNNVPRSRMLKDDALFEIAQQAPKNSEALGRLRTIGRGWENSRHAGGLLAAINEALNVPHDALPKLAKHKSPPEGTGSAVDLLRVLLKYICEANEVAPKLIASGGDLEQLAILGDKADIRALAGWRHDLFGKKALELLSGKMAIGFKDQALHIVEVE